VTIHSRPFPSSRVKVCVFPTVTVLPLQSRNYQVSAVLGVSTQLSTPVRCILDTGAGPNIIRLSVLPDIWERYRVREAKRPTIIGAGGRRLRQCGTVALQVELGKLRTSAQFIVVENLVADCILGCQFINKQVTAILPKEKVVRLVDNSLVPILKDTDPLRPTAIPETPEASPSTKVRVAKFSKVLAQAETLIWVQCAAPGLHFLQAHHRESDRTGVSLANGIADILPMEPFPVRVINTSTQDRILPKGMVLGHALPHPRQIIHLVEEGDTEREFPQGPRIPDIEGNLWKQEVNLNHLTPHMRDKVYRMLHNHRLLWDGRLGRVSATSHRIELTPGARPVHCQPYRAGPRAREAETQEVHRMLKEGVIEPAASEWASPVVLVPKPDGSMRFCVDYRKLNAITIRDTYPLPRMDECIDSLGDANVFTTLDCNSGYWQIPVAPEDMDKTTFTSHEGTYRFRRMPFGLRNAPATFQRVVDIVLSGLTWKSCLVYLDDIIIYSQTMEDHLTHLHDVLTLLGQAGLSLKLAKCHFLQETVDYLGHVIRPGKLEIATKNTDALRTAQPPRTQTELRSFLGLCNVYRRFVPGFSKIAGPLNQMLRKGESPRLGALSVEQLHAFESLRDNLLHPPVLALPRKAGRYVLDTDASDLQIGSCLCQEHPDGLRHPIGYWSRSLNAAERNYSTTEKECLAIVWAILTLRPYLEGQRFLVRTDHHSLRWVLNLADAQGRLARWRLRLLEFDFEVEYAPGKEHHAADTMSRLLPPARTEPPLDTAIPCFATQRGTVRAYLPQRNLHLGNAPKEHLAPQHISNGRTTGGQFPQETADHRQYPYIINEMPVPDSSKDPSLVSLDDFRDKQLTDHRYGHWATQHDVDLDDHGILGHTLPSGEWSAIQTSGGHPITVFLTEDELHAHEDARLFRRENSPVNAPISEKGLHVGPLDVVAATSSPMPTAIQREEFLREQAADAECQRLLNTPVTYTPFDINDDGVLVRIAPLDKSQQIVVPASLQPRLLHLEHYPQTAGHPGVSRMIRSMRRRFFWPRMAADVAETVRSCTTCAKNRIKERNRTSFLKLFPASAPLEYVAIDILGPLPKTGHGNRFLLVMTDRFSKLTRTVPLRTTTALVCARAFCDHWVYTYGAPRHVLTDNGPQFTAKFFHAVCRELGIEKVFTTAYHPQTNGQVERFNRTILNSLRGYIAANQNNWDEFTSALTFAYNARVHTAIGLAPFELVLSRPPVTLSTENPSTEIEISAETEKLRFLRRLKELLPMAAERLRMAQQRYKRNYDAHVRPKNQGIPEGGWVYVRKEVYDAGVNPKLLDQVDGPFQVADKDDHTMLLRMGDHLVRVSSDRITPAPTPRTHSNEMSSSPNASEPVTVDTGEPDLVALPAQKGARLVDESVEDDMEYVIDRIVGMRKESDGTIRYRIRWYGYNRDADTWEPEGNLPGPMVRSYNRRVGLVTTN
jgi:transposase InsO family protein